MNRPRKQAIEDITPARVRVLELISRLGLVTREGVLRCYFAPKAGAHVWQHLIRLEEIGYITHEELSLKPGDNGTHIYLPTSKGNNYLVKEWFRTSYGLVKPRSIAINRHNLEAQEPLILTHELTKHYPQIKLISFLSEPVLRQAPISGTGPDGVVKLHYGQVGESLFTFEWDRSTESADKIRDKIDGYLGLGEAENTQKRLEQWGSVNLISVWILPDQDRLRQVLEVVQQHLHQTESENYASAFWFGLPTDYETFFFGAHWSIPFQANKSALLRREWLR